jgi:hypothetical protein
MTRRSPTFGRSTRLAAVTVLAVLALLVPGSLAQEGTPAGAAQGEAHPAHIHSGTCAELGDVVAPLPDVIDPGTGLEFQGVPDAIVVDVSVSTVDLSLDELLASPHAINVHQSAEEIDVYIACGDIGGHLLTSVEGRQFMLIGLAEQNDSGRSGTAWLGEEGDEQTDVSISLLE